MGIQERKLREKEQRIREILRAAKDMFLSKGYIHTTMLDIAERSELSRRTVYLYFKSKDEISFAVMNDAFHKLRDKIKEASEQQGTAIERLGFMKQAYIDFFKLNYEDFYFTLYFDLKLNMRNISSHEAQTTFDYVLEIINTLVDVLKAGEKEGSIRSLQDLQLTAFTFVTIIHSTMQKIATRQELLEHASQFSQEQVITETFDLLFHSILKS